MSETIFIVEDDQTIISVIEKQLQQWGYQVLVPVDFQQVVAECQQAAPDLVLMDISLPYYNGFHWTKLIREVSEVPIIFLSSADDQMNQVMAMSMGADDFIAKPFDLAILLAKIQALLRRSYQYGNQSQVFTFGKWRFLPTENLIEGPQQLLLSPNESRILMVLLQQRGKVVSRETIIEALWQSDEFIDNNTLAVNMTRLRKKLAGVAITDLIQTVKNKGYLIEEEEQ